jgi:hypothetical protein
VRHGKRIIMGASAVMGSRDYMRKMSYERTMEGVLTEIEEKGRMLAGRQAANFAPSLVCAC